jgi:hypothetical protein
MDKSSQPGKQSKEHYFDTINGLLNGIVPDAVIAEITAFEHNISTINLASTETIKEHFFRKEYFFSLVKELICIAYPPQSVDTVCLSTIMAHEVISTEHRGDFSYFLGSTFLDQHPAINTSKRIDIYQDLWSDILDIKRNLFSIYTKSIRSDKDKILMFDIKHQDIDPSKTYLLLTQGYSLPLYIQDLYPNIIFAGAALRIGHRYDSLMVPLFEVNDYFVIPEYDANGLRLSLAKKDNLKLEPNIQYVDNLEL